MKTNFSVIIPMANEEKDFFPFVNSLKKVLKKIGRGQIYFIIDNVSKDKTLAMCNELSEQDDRFTTVWAPENKNVVDAYIRGYKEALIKNHDLIIEMDAGLSHDPEELPLFLNALEDGYECVFGSRFMKEGHIHDSNWKRTFLSRVGTILANLLLGTRMRDMTSGFQGFHSNIVKKFVEYPILSRAHFYQTELRYLLRKTNFTEIPIHYRAPSPRVSKKAIYNSIYVLLYYFFRRVTFRSLYIK